MNKQGIVVFTEARRAPNTVAARSALVEKVLNETYQTAYIKKHPDLRSEVDRIVSATIRRLRSGKFAALR